MKKRNNKRRNVNYILKLAFEPKLWFVFIIPMLAIILSQKDVISSLLSARIFNNFQFAVEGDHDISFLKKAIFLSVLLFLTDIFEWLFNTISDLIENYWREHVSVKLEKSFIEKDFKTDIADFDNPNLKSRRSLAQAVDPVGQIKAAITCIGKILVTFSFAAILWRYSPVMVFVAVIIKIPTYFVIGKINNENREFRIETGVVNREKNYYKNIPVDRATAKEFKMFDMKAYICEKYKIIVEKYYKFFKGKYVKNATGNSLLEYYDKVIIIAAQIVIGISVFTGSMMFGDYILFISAFKNLYGSAESLASYAAQFKDMRIQNNMLREYIENNSIFENGEGKVVNVSNKLHTFEFKDVSFTYPGTTKEILHNLNLTIYGGKTYGIVGLNGSGKSTLVNLLLRLYEPDSGEILLDGVNIKKYNIYSYYETIACVFQCTTHYAMTIKDYIASGNACDENKVRSAINKVKLDAWCNELQHGIDTMLTRAFSSENNSVEPSMGQWQKLSIARAIYKDSPIMILDEPSASLDVDSEHEIFKYIARLADTKTAILISHRLSNIIECDHIFVLQDGNLAEQGNHLELLEMGGIYANLFNSQAKYYKSEEE